MGILSIVKHRCIEQMLKACTHVVEAGEKIAEARSMKKSTQSVDIAVQRQRTSCTISSSTVVVDLIVQTTRRLIRGISMLTREASAAMPWTRRMAS